MMKNRAGVLALVVLAIATILMVFVVLPQMSGGKKGVADLANKASDAVKDATKAASDTAGTAADTVAKTAADVAKEAQTAVLAKMDRLKADASTAAGDLQGLFKDAKVPTVDEIAAGKAKAEAALKSVVDVQLPEGMDATLAAGAKAATDAAAKSLALVQAIPADVEGARTAIAAFAASMGLPALPDVAKVAEPAKPADAAATTAEAPKPADTAAAPATPATPAVPEDPTAKWVMPSFDVVRVEKDGSMVVAGRGEPGTKLQIMNGDTVIATTDLDQDGNFVAVLDNPLAPGDYSLVLKLTDKNGLSKTSEEVATVSVPKDSSGQLLAMVTKAGEASRILTTPDAPKPAAVAAAAPAADAPAPAAVEIKTPDLPAASNAIAGSAPVVDTAAAPAAATADATAPAATTPAADAKPAPAADTKPAVPDVVVTAVELEGDKIFVAGTTKPGLTVRAYADDKIVGEAKAEANGAFVADGKMDLSVGTHTIRVDALDDKGNVAFRATVPFNRPEGEQVAVVAQADAPAGAKAAMEMLGDGKFDQLRGEAAKAIDLLKSLFVDGKVPTGEQLAAARSSLQFALKSLAEFKLPENADAASLDLVSRVATSAKDALAGSDGASTRRSRC